MRLDRRAPRLPMTCGGMASLVSRGCWLVGITALWAVASGTALGQWSGTNPLTTTSSVGIGTTTPQGGLHSATAPQWSSWNYGPSVVVDGTRNNVLALLDSTHSNAWAIGSASVGGIPGLQFSAMPPLGDITTGLVIALTMRPNGNVGIGTFNPAYRLSVNGTIQAKEVLVNTGWADHVFSPEYRLKPLAEVERYVLENGHLPGIPSETQVKEKGVGLGEMQVKLLEKIEEMTLHMIRAEKRGERLEKENQELRERLAKLEAREGERE